MDADSGNEDKIPAILRIPDPIRWAIAIFAAASTFALFVWARAFLYKGGEPPEVAVWAVSTAYAVFVGTVLAPPRFPKAVRAFLISLAVCVSLMLALGDVVLRHKLMATDVERVLGAVIGVIVARYVLRRA
jgi:hypothetical protein